MNISTPYSLTKYIWEGFLYVLYVLAHSESMHMHTYIKIYCHELPGGSSDSVSMRIMHKKRKGTPTPYWCLVGSSWSALPADQAQWEQGDSNPSFMVNSNLNLHLAVLPSTTAGLLLHRAIERTLSQEMRGSRDSAAPVFLIATKM